MMAIIYFYVTSSRAVQCIFAFLVPTLYTVTNITHPMEEQPQTPETNLQKFLKTKPSMILGMAIAIGLGILLMYLGVFSQCCGIGYLIVACVALYVPKFFGLTKLQFLLVFGVVFFLIITAVGAICVSKPMLERESNYQDFNDSGFSNVTFDYVNGGVDVTFTYSGTGDVKFCFYQVQLVTYQFISKTNGEPYEHAVTPTAGTYSIRLDGIPAGFPYQYHFEAVNGETKTVSASGYYLGAINDSELDKFCLVYNAYSCGIITVLFFLMVILTTISRRNLEKTRAKMEADGRLYPKGYGRCKECGSIVLPGETSCRKCGAYIDVPEELRHKKVDLVRCSECGAEIPEDVNVCPKCGAAFDEEEEVVYVDSTEKTVEMVQCSECGSMIPEDAEVCPKCGAKFDEEEEIVVADSEKKE